MLSEWPEWLINTALPLNRWLHIVACTLMVGGVLFFEMVLPLATADLREEQQLAVFGRARWVFRRVFLLSILLLIITGTVSTWRMWRLYHFDEQTVGGFFQGSRPWVIGHVFLALLAFWIGLRVTRTKFLLPRPVSWLRVLLVILLVSMFTASVARHMRLRIDHMRKYPQGHGESPV
jgi:uncharacterized membrane protein